MPLVVLCGIPASGKTTFSNQLEARFQSLGKKTCIVNEETLNIQKKEGYKDAKAEKMTRALLKSTVESKLDKETIVILDSLNYIKGCRYELFCIAKSLQTTYCVVFVNTLIDIAREWNTKRDNQFDSSIFEGLVHQLEVPNSKNRWDNPLVELTSETLQDTLSVEKVEEVILQGKAPTPGLATQSAPIRSFNFLYEVDTITQSILKSLLTRQRDAMIGDVLLLSNTSHPIQLNRKISPGESRRLRQQFVKLITMHPIDISRIGDEFVDYLNEFLAKDQ